MSDVRPTYGPISIRTIFRAFLADHPEHLPDVRPIATPNGIRMAVNRAGLLTFIPWGIAKGVIDPVRTRPFLEYLKSLPPDDQ